ncbi:MAG: sulfite exporter TauE/SafE family protein [Patescibacteria group bacterium]
MNLWLIFITGLTVGGLTCLAVQGGLLASVIAARERKYAFWATAVFLISKLAAYTILGFILGTFGGALNINPGVQTTMQLIAGLYMIAVALNLLNVHPIFRYVIIQPPRFLTRMIRNQSKSKDLFAPAFLGAMTIFIPCGTTIAMETLAIASANALLGASIMAVFVLGTMPLFFGVGVLTSAFQGKFLKLAAFAVLYLGISSFNGSLVAIGSPITLQSIRDAIPVQINLSGNVPASANSSLIPIINGVQTANISVLPNGYSPNYIQVKSEVPVKLNLSTTGGFGCTVGFRIPKLGITKDLSRENPVTVEFTPQRREKIAWTCSMGMYTGVIEVI